MTERLPSLRGIEAFIKSAETLSFQDGARKLNVSASAISKRIREFELDIGFKLFCRETRSLRLTPAGEQYLRNLIPAYNALHSITSAARLDQRSSRLRVAAFPAFCADWLEAEMVRNAPEFTARVDLVRIDHRTAIDRTADIAIWGGPGTITLRPGSKKLFDLRLAPICRPEFVDAGIPNDPRQLLQSTLLGFRAAADAWPRWFTSAGVSCQTAHHGSYDVLGNVILFDTPACLVEAAVEGMGIGIGDMIFARSYIESGLLVRPFPIYCDYPRAVYMRVQNELTNSALVSSFEQWIGEIVGTARLIGA